MGLLLFASFMTLFVFLSESNPELKTSSDCRYDNRQWLHTYLEQSGIGFICKQRPNANFEPVCKYDDNGALTKLYISYLRHKPTDTEFNEVNVNTLCLSECPSTNVAYDRNVLIHFSETGHNHTVYMSCINGLVFDEYATDMVMLTCDQFRQSWALLKLDQSVILPRVDRKLTLTCGKGRKSGVVSDKRGLAYLNAVLVLVSLL